MRIYSSRRLVNKFDTASHTVANEALLQREGGPLVREPVTKCPSCQSIALYKYGNVRNKQRFLCLMCGRQFLLGCERHYPAERPVCAICGKKMYVYQKETTCVRYRCSAYPACRGYLKVKNIKT